MDSDIKQLLEKFKEELTLDGRKKVFEDDYKLSTDFMKQKSDPEAFTKEFLIEPIIRKFNLSKLPERHFRGIRQDLRKVDYLLKNQKGKAFLAEAKPLNSDLFDKSVHGAVNQIKGLFRLAEVQKDYEFGIATDGLKWIFIGKNSKVVFQYDLRDDLDKIKEILIGKEEVSSERIEEEISKKFYIWYNALLHGGKYKDHENKTRIISNKDCLVENILSVSNPEDREQIAQTIMDRLIFIKFLQSKEIVGYDILDYLLKLDENILNEKLKQLFFSVLNTKKSKRVDIDPKFKNIPYLNGSLFVRTEIESKNPDYKIRSYILREVIQFLDSFKFIHIEDVSNEKILDPEILGYIFERAMTATDRKGTGAFYTPKTITTYISKNTINPVIVKRVNKLLKEKGYKDSELLKDIEEVYRLRESTLGEVFSHLILDLKICDNACGSGAFLLAAADIILDVYKRINDELRLKNSEIALRKLILQNNLYGVDINPNAVEIAKLRLWLWLVTAYEPDKVEPLPNIDYNIRVGNSLIGYTDITKFKEHKLTLLDWYSAEKSLNLMLKKREDKIQEYKTAVGDKARELKSEIDDLDRKIKKLLDINLFQEINKKVKIDEEEFRKTEPFHWGFEFYSIFDGNGGREKGFDVMIGNPPYIKHQSLRKLSPIFKSLYNCYAGTADIYVYFYERGIDLLAKDAYLCFITSNKFMKTSYGENLRKFLTENKTIHQIIVFDRVNVFDALVSSSILFVSTETQEKNKVFVSIVNRDLEPNETILEYINENNFSMEQALLGKNIWNLTQKEIVEIKNKIESSGKPLENIEGVKINRGVTTGFNDAFVIDKKTKNELVKDSRNKNIIKALLRGRDIKKWDYTFSDLWLIFTRRGIDIDKFPSIKKHLEKFRTQLTPRKKEGEEGRKPGDYKWFEIQDNVAYFPEFEKEKIVWGLTADKWAYALDAKKHYLPSNAYILTSEKINLKYILGVLNSKVMQFYFSQIGIMTAGGAYTLKYSTIKKFPLTIPSEKIQKEVVEIVDKIIETKKKGGDVSNYEEKLNNLVYRIYGITDKEKEIIEK
jgi:hypothetical protein